VKLSEAQVLVMRGPGTNCDAETAAAIVELGAKAEVVHVNRFIKGKRSLEEFHGLVIPGGFSFGDRIRSGAIFGKMLSYSLRRELQSFVDEGKPILGICNGFQVLIESGLLPFGEVGEPTLALAKNASARFEDRWIYLLKCNSSLFTLKLKNISRMPVANAEGRVVLPLGEEERMLAQLEENHQVALRYCSAEGEVAQGEYPLNPSGSYADIAGLTSPEGTILGMMPHPERAFYRYMYPDWTRGNDEVKGDGYAIFEGMLTYITERF
jgi:phosphoribosylformylglycinamidine synthase